MSDRDGAGGPSDDAAATVADATAETALEGDGARTSIEGDPGPASQRDDRLARGTLVGRYVVSGVLGAGGMGVVYAAFDPELDRRVAIKLLQARTGGGSESGGQAWLLREAQAMARLAHPNVVAVYDVGAIPGDRVFVAMELVEGVTLRKWLQLKRSWREIVAVMRAAGTGLAAAHAAGLVHRDFKPDNVIVGNDGRVRVMDFGLARLNPTDEPAGRSSDLQIEGKSPLSDSLTEAGKVRGTPAYMAPEIYRGLGADTRADQFAFGVALYEALYRVKPFDRRDLIAKRATPPTPPATANVPAWVERVVVRAIALDPDHRFATMDELLAALAADPTARRRRIAIGAAVAVACGGLVVGVFVLRGGDRASELCRGARTELAATWNATTRTALEAAFRKVDRPFAADAITGAEKALDAYGAGWVAMRTEACSATRVRGHQSEDVLTLRMVCLDNRLVELRTLVGLFAAADEPLVRGAVTSAHKLGSLADCADVPALLAPDPLPRDPDARRQVAALQARLAEARADYSAGRPADTLAIATAVAPDAERLGHLPTQALGHLLAGQTRWILQGADQGEPELLLAATTAEAGKADEVKAEAYLQLTNLATEQSRFDVAQERWQQASAALARAGSKWELDVRVLAARALLASRQNQFDDALAAAGQARAAAKDHADSPTYAYALLVEASILNAAGRPDEAIADFRTVLAYQDEVGHRRLEVAVILQNMASAELQLGRPADAIGHIGTALEIDEAIYGPESVEVARALSVLGAAQQTGNQLAEGLATDQRALAIAAKTLGEDDDLYAMILGQVAGCLIGLERAADALPYLDRAVAIQTAKLGPGHVQTLTLVLTQCDALSEVGKLDAAIAACRSALAAGEQSLGKDSPILFLFHAHLGTVELDAKQWQAARASFERALALGATDPADVHVVTLLAARATWGAGDRRRAIELANKARDGFAAMGDTHADQVREADEWLKTHVAKLK